MLPLLWTTRLAVFFAGGGGSRLGPQAIACLAYPDAALLATAALLSDRDIYQIKRRTKNRPPGFFLGGLRVFLFIPNLL